MRLYGAQYSWNKRLKTFKRSRRTRVLCHSNATTVAYPETAVVNGIWARKARRVNRKRQKVFRFASAQALQIYFGLTRRKLRSYWTPAKDDRSRLVGLELRADMVLMRSGLVTSIREARHFISCGFVNRWCLIPQADGSLCGIWVSVQRGSERMSPGEFLGFDSTFYYDEVVESVLGRVASRKQQKFTPVHLNVDYLHGLIGVVSMPKSDGLLILPKGLKLSTQLFTS